MKDVIAHWEKLKAHADECATMRNLSTDEQKRELFALLAEQLGGLASEAERLITARPKGGKIR